MTDIGRGVTFPAVIYFGTGGRGGTTDLEAIISRLADTARERLIISGPQVLDIVRRNGRFRKSWVVGRIGNDELVVADNRMTGQKLHPHNSELHVTNLAATMVSRPDLFRFIVDLSRDKLGFYTPHFTRHFEYTWFAERFEGDVLGQEIADIGAGLSPVPIFIAERGAIVHCIDHSRLIRTQENRADWNEWGFLDYSKLHPNMRAYNIDITKFQPESRFDAIYSISVIEHMPREIWEHTLRLTASWLKKGGQLLLTLDLLQGTDWLWNIAGGVEFAPRETHGGIKDVLNVLRACGFTIKEITIQRDIPYSVTDIVYLDCGL